jgi:hypothetical protein
MPSCKFEEDNNVIHMPEFYFGPTPGFKGSEIASQINELLLCFRRGIHVDISWNYRILVSLVASSVLADKTLVASGRFRSLEDKIDQYPETDAIFMSTKAIKIFTGELVKRLTRPMMESNLDLTYHHGDKVFQIYRKPIQDDEIQLVTWKV